MLRDLGLPSEVARIAAELVRFWFVWLKGFLGALYVTVVSNTELMPWSPVVSIQRRLHDTVAAVASWAMRSRSLREPLKTCASVGLARFTSRPPLFPRGGHAAYKVRVTSYMSFVSSLVAQNASRDPLKPSVPHLKLRDMLREVIWRQSQVELR